MVKLVNYNPETSEVLQVIDTTNSSIFSLPEKGALVSINEQQFDFIQQARTWTNGKTFTHEEPPATYYQLNNDGQWIKDRNAEQEALKQKQKDLMLELKRIAEELSQKPLEEYPTIEAISFERQLAEAKAYLENPSTARVPTLSGIAMRRGLTVGELAEKVVKKANDFEQLVAIVAGQRQAFLDKVEAATTFEVLAEIEEDIKNWETGKEIKLKPAIAQ